jgi:hypothetical protein
MTPPPKTSSSSSGRLARDLKVFLQVRTSRPDRPGRLQAPHQRATNCGCVARVCGLTERTQRTLGSVSRQARFVAGPTHAVIVSRRDAAPVGIEGRRWGAGLVSPLLQGLGHPSEPDGDRPPCRG